MPYDPEREWMLMRAKQLGIDPNDPNRVFFRDTSGYKQKDWLNRDHLLEIGMQAKALGLPVDRAIATIIAESQSDLSKNNPGHLTKGTRADYAKRMGLPYKQALMNTLNMQGGTEAGDRPYLTSQEDADALEYANWRDDIRLSLGKLKAMREKFGPNSIEAQQAYSGTGETIYPGQGANKQRWFGGQDLNNYNVWENKPQGTKTMAMEKELYKNPWFGTLLQYINNEKGNYYFDWLKDTQNKIDARKRSVEEELYF